MRGRIPRVSLQELSSVKSYRFGTLASVFLLASMLLTTLSLTTPSQAQGSGPRQVFGGYLGGSSSVDYGRAVALDAQGNIYLAGDTGSTSFFGFNVPIVGGSDVLVLKLSPDGRSVLAGYVFGSSGFDEVLDMVVTPAGEPVLTVYTGEADWPVQRALLAEQPYGNAGVLVKLNAALDDVVFSTYAGMSMSNQGGQNLGLDAQGNIYVTGALYIAEARTRDLIVKKYSPDGQQELYRQVFADDLTGEEGHSLEVLPDGTVYATGRVRGARLPVTSDALQAICGRHLVRDPESIDCDDDAFVAIFDPTGSPRYVSYLGGDGNDYAVDLAVDGQGGIVVVGLAGSEDFPTTTNSLQPHCAAEPGNGCYHDSFVTRLSADGRRLVYSTYLHSNHTSMHDFVTQVVADAQGRASVVGFTSGEGFPLQQPIQAALKTTPCVITTPYPRFCYDGFITTFAPDGSLVFSSYHGGAVDDHLEDVALGPDGSLYLTGLTKSNGFPVTPNAPQQQNAGGSDWFLSRIAPGGGEGPVPTLPAQRYLPMLLR
jgi:hypothetical protein